MKTPKVLVLCERSGTIRNAFGAAGFEVTSVDTLGSTSENVGNSWHVVDDALEWLNTPMPFDLVIARPPCTYLANSGGKNLYQLDKGHTVRDADGHLIPNVGRWHMLADAIDFFRAMQTANAPRIAVENPIPHKHGREGFTAAQPGGDVGVARETGIGRPAQYVQPWQYGLPEKKATGLWLTNLPPLVPTNDVKAHMLTLPKAQQNRVHYASPGPDRWKERSSLAQGIADAMVAQWGPLLTKEANS